MVKLGVIPGIPDVHVAWNSRLHCIELKAPKGHLTPLQTQVIERLDECGVPTVVCRNLDQVEHALRMWGIPLSARLGS